MKILLVDDQKTIVDSLKKEIRWERIQAERVFTACSAKEAKMVLQNFDVDILVTDIEMPEENGLSLFQWTRENKPNVEGVFLTSHADFQYAQEAMHLGGFDYLLQPARYEDLEEILIRASMKIKRQKKLGKLEDTKKMVHEQKSNILDGLLRKISIGNAEAANHLYDCFPELFQLEYSETITLPILVEILRWKKAEESWDEKLVSLVFSNVMEELFETAAGNVAVSSLYQNRCWILLVLEKGKANKDLYSHGIDQLYSFIETNMEFQIAIYPSIETDTQDFSLIIQNLTKRADENIGKANGVFWTGPESKEILHSEDIIQLAIDYIHQNISKNVSRSDVAELVHLNEEYFSRLFRQRTGYTFKDYVMKEKMNAAKKMLTESHLSIGIIASKVGYDNFSHFSKMFKKLTNMTPQEYRKEKPAK